MSHDVAALTKARTFKALYVEQLVRVLEHVNVHDEEAAFFDGTDFYSMDNVREERRPWTRWVASDLACSKPRLIRSEGSCRSFYEGSLTPMQLLVDLVRRLPPPRSVVHPC